MTTKDEINAWFKTINEETKPEELKVMAYGNLLRVHLSEEKPFHILGNTGKCGTQN